MRCLLLLLLASCTLQSTAIDPCVRYYPTDRVLQTKQHPFPPLTEEELSTPWGQELFCGLQFGEEMDLYRSITSLKKARMLCPSDTERKAQIDYSLILAYYLGGKYEEAICYFEQGAISSVSPSFPGYHTLLLVLFECYDKGGYPYKAQAVLDVLQTTYPEEVPLLQAGTCLETNNLQPLACLPLSETTQQTLGTFVSCYTKEKKDPSVARWLNASLPGAGYWYVGQPKSAITSLTLNALFIAATWQLFDRGYVAPALFTLSLEAGWYLGGINGAGLAAKEYNESLYNCYAKEAMLQERLFPLLLIHYAF